MTATANATGVMRSQRTLVENALLVCITAERLLARLEDVLPSKSAVFKEPNVLVIKS